MNRGLVPERSDTLPVKGVIFDMDGVLTDSEWFIAEAARIMFWETHGLPVSHGDFLPFVGLGENRFLGGVAEKYGLPGFDLERDKRRTYEIYRDIVKGKLKALPGAVAFVRRCRDLGLKIALATSTDYTKMMANLEEINLAEGVFDALVNGLDVERRKPFPDLFLEAARRIGLEGRFCWVVEDSVGGVTAAKAAGMRCLGLLTTFPEAEIRAAGADLIVPDLSALSADALLPS
ncbi:MAG: HAD-IA family hydrolase [Treponema sp.]|nr:HAD-IA family hydrolase [Treponema sp.]